MGEDELKIKLKQVKDFLNKNEESYAEDLPIYMFWGKEDVEAIETILDLYNKTKEDNKLYRIGMIRDQDFKDSLIDILGVGDNEETILAELEKKDKIIELMIKHLCDVIDSDDNASLLPFYDSDDNLEEKVKEYFERKAENE